MLYFAYGSNLNHFQIKRRCKDSVFLKKYELKNYRLNFRSKYRAADIEKKKNSIVPGALFEISKSDEKKLDVYEDFPILYKKYYFYYNEQKGLLVASLASLFAEKFFKDVVHIEQKRYWSSVWAGKWHTRLL